MQQIPGTMIEDGGVKRDDLNTATSGQAVIRKIIAGSNVSLSSTGADAGTGDVTVNAGYSYGTASNIRLALSAGTFSLKGNDGNALSVSNQGKVNCQSATGGLIVPIMVTGLHAINDGNHASSDLTGFEWGLTAGVNYQQDRPKFLYLANKGDLDADGSDGSSAFFFAASPCLTSTPASAGLIGDTAAAPTTDNQNAIIFLQRVTAANYLSLPCVCLGAVRMRYLGSSTDWYIQALTAADGLGRYHEEDVLPVPAGQFGNQAGKLYNVADGSTALAFSVQNAWMQLLKSGLCRYNVEVSNCTANGADAANLKFFLPYSAKVIGGGGSYQAQRGQAGIKSLQVLANTWGPTRYPQAFYSGEVAVFDANPSYALVYDGQNTAVDDNDFAVNAASRIVFEITYKAF